MRFTDEYYNKEKMILRDHLAMERTKLANERTLFSYIRTSLYLLLGGIALVELESFRHLSFLGYISLAGSVLLFCLGTYRFCELKLHLRKLTRQQKEIPEGNSGDNNAK